MSDIHPTAILEGEIDLADDVEIGPYCVLKGRITLGAGTRLIGGVWLQGPLTMGEGNTLYPGAALGFAPQDRSWDPKRPGAGLVLGSRNVFREGVSVSRATKDDAPTTIGDDAYFMACSHAGHDCRVGNNVTFANAVLLAGHVTIEDRVNIGGGGAVHQFCRVGRGAMLGGGLILTRDLPPFFMLTGNNCAGSLNMVGLRRSGMPADDIEDVRWVYKTFYRRDLSVKKATEELHQRADRPIVAEMIEFLGKSTRGLCPGVGDSRR